MQLISSGRLLGARIEGLDLSTALENGEVEGIVDALGHHGVLCFPRQKLTARQQRDFAARFGELEVNVASGPYQEPGLPEVMIGARSNVDLRSEEHTSELQSRL